MAISMLKIRRPLGRLIFNMGIAIPGKTIFLIETTPRSAKNHYGPGSTRDDSILVDWWGYRRDGYVDCIEFVGILIKEKHIVILVHKLPI